MNWLNDLFKSLMLSLYLPLKCHIPSILRFSSWIALNGDNDSGAEQDAIIFIAKNKYKIKNFFMRIPSCYKLVII